MVNKTPTLYICNAFSTAMLPAWRLSDQFGSSHIMIHAIQDPKGWLAEAEKRHGFAVSAVGHADTAAVFADTLGIDVPVNRQNIVLDENTELLVGQLIGNRLPEGATTLPPGSRIMWVRVALGI